MLTLWRPETPKTGTLAKSEDPDEMPHHPAGNQKLTTKYKCQILFCGLLVFSLSMYRAGDFLLFSRGRISAPFPIENTVNLVLVRTLE